MIRIVIATLAFAGMVAGNSRLLIVLFVSEFSAGQLASRIVTYLACFTASALLYYMALIW